MSVLQSMRVESTKLILMTCAIALATIFIVYFFGDGERRYLLKYPLETSLSGFTTLHSDRKVTKIFPVEICINSVTREYLQCGWAIITKLKQPRMSEYVQIDGVASQANRKQ